LLISLGRLFDLSVVAFGRSRSGGITTREIHPSMGPRFSVFVFLFDIQRSPGRKEESIPLAILLPAIGIILRRVKVRPHAHGVDVLVLLVPPTIDDFHQTRVAVETFQFRVRDRSGLVFELIGC
jgi:hypothetical protein